MRKNKLTLYIKVSSLSLFIDVFFRKNKIKGYNLKN